MIGKYTIDFYITIIMTIHKILNTWFPSYNNVTICTYIYASVLSKIDGIIDL